jgi:hypothetical protein
VLDPQGNVTMTSAATDVRDPGTRLTLAHIMHLDWKKLTESLRRTHGRSEPSSVRRRRRHEPRKGWGSALRREAILLCRRTDCGNGDAPHEHLHLPHRMYVEQHGERVRVAMALVQHDT